MCPVTHKPKYGAALAHEIANRERRRKHDSITAYRCGFCHQWHVGGSKRAGKRPRLRANHKTVMLGPMKGF